MLKFRYGQEFCSWCLATPSLQGVPGALVSSLEVQTLALDY